jgi:hypothetical protein
MHPDARGGRSGHPFFETQRRGGSGVRQNLPEKISNFSLKIYRQRSPDTNFSTHWYPEINEMLQILGIGVAL